MKNQTACFTGHRHISGSELQYIKKQLQKTIKHLIGEGIIYFGCGGAIGFDTLAGFTVNEMKQEFPHIKLIVVQPCENQDAKWNAAQKAEYQKLLSVADKVKPLQKKYDNSCMLKRNRHLVDNSCVCIAYLNHSRGGTAYTVNYAHSVGLSVINLNDEISNQIPEK